METKVVKIRGCKVEIPKDFELIKEDGIIKIKKPIRFINNLNARISGYYIDLASRIRTSNEAFNIPTNYNIFYTEKQAKSALAMARISQIIANDKRYNGIIIDKEWEKVRYKIRYLIIKNCNNNLEIVTSFNYHFLSFHTIDGAKLFLEENKELLKDYFMF